LNFYRSELALFLEETRKKRGYDGKPLIKYPKNFDEVANAMNRNDLNTSDDRLKYNITRNFLVSYFLDLELGRFLYWQKNLTKILKRTLRAGDTGDCALFLNI